MNIRGGGITSVKDYESDEMRVFRGGMRNIADHQDHMVYDTKRSIRNFHDVGSYERGFIQHSRSPANQYINFHFMYGGVRKYIVDRLMYQHFYRKYVRNFWFPVVLSYTCLILFKNILVGCVSMRMYENACYDYFYFSD